MGPVQLPIAPMLQLLLVAFVLQAAPSSSPADFDKVFTGKTLRIGYVHTNARAGSGPHGGTLAPLPPAAAYENSEELITNPMLQVELEWAGSRANLIDSSGLGKYRIELSDLATKRLIFSSSFCSIYGEWETTPESKFIDTFAESLRVPEPRQNFRWTIQKRGGDETFRELSSMDIDFSDDSWTRRESMTRHSPVDRTSPNGGAEVVTIFDNGDLAHHVDLLIAADGYKKEQGDKFVADAKRLVDALFQTEPYRRRKSDFNVRALFRPTPFDEAGIGNPRAGIGHDTNFGMSYNAFGSDRYVLAMNDDRLRDICAQSPYDALILLFNERKYGGGGIYNLWATVAADTEPAAYIFVHEFGHSFAGLADEYYTSQVAYEDLIKPGIEPWEPNVTALLDPTKLKWKDLVAKQTPLPTPWGQKHFDEVDLAYQKRRAEMIDAKASEAEMEALFREVKGQTGPLLANEKFAGKVGAFEGASYQAKGLYRPEVDCIMFTRNPTQFCRVCERAIERTIDSYVR